MGRALRTLSRAGGAQTGGSGEGVGCPLAARLQPYLSVPAALVGAHVFLLNCQEHPPSGLMCELPANTLLPWRGQSRCPSGCLPRAA